MRAFFTYKCLLFAVLQVLALGGTGLRAQAQATYGQEWINFNQQYHKISVTREGVYRLDYNYLAAAGLANADPRNLQLFRRGRQVAVWVQGQDDGRLDNSDYLEFFGQKNDGMTDGELYRKPDEKVHNYYSLYTDTAAYFLTLHPSQPGKRMALQQPDPANLNPETWHWQTRLALVTGNYSRGIAYADSQQPFGDTAEGFFSDYFGALGGGKNRLNPYTYVVDSLLNVETSGPRPEMEIALVGSQYASHNVRISLVAGSTEKVLDNLVQFEPFGHVKLRYPLEFSDMAAGKLTVRIAVLSQVPVGSPPDLVRLAYIRVRYPRKNILPNGRDLYLGLADTTKAMASYLLFEGAAADALAYEVTDPDNVVRTPSLPAGSQRGFVLAAGAGRQRRFLLTAAHKFFVPAPARQRSFRPIDPAKAAYVIISNKQLAKPIPGYPNPVRAYADYRASAAGGGHDTLLFYTDQLYDQFHYGDRSALAIRRLMRYLLANGNPQYLFLLGKGVEPDFADGGFRRNPGAYAVIDLVPTGGAPGSDVVFTADYQQNSFAPRVATGRVAAMNAAEVGSYLDKVKMHEATPANAAWRKDLLHLGGGSDAGQQQLFRDFLRNYEYTATGPLFGARVQTISRQTSANAVDFINLSEQVNQGLSVVTFFGHSSPSGADIDFGYVSNPVNNYNNLGKYPMLLVNGCFSGNAFSAVSASQRSFGEDWVLTPRKGAIAFIAHSAFGFTGPLHTYSRNLYQLAFSDPDFYGKPIGVVTREVVRRMGQSGNDQLGSTALEMVLQADPAVVISGPEKPDYALSQQITLRSFQFAEKVTAATDSFQVVIPVRNLGKVSQDSFHVSVSRNGVQLKSRRKFPPVLYQDTLLFTFNLTEGRMAGENSFSVTIDPDNHIAELDEINNTAQFTLNLPSSGARALFPLEYALVQSPEVKLVGQATNLLQANRTYYFELDTTRTFNSPVLKYQEVEAGPYPAATFALLPGAAPRDSVVYYWRFRLKDDQQTLGDTIWGESSFRYIPGSAPGWSQSQYGQFTKAEGENITLNPVSKQWEFTTTSKNLRLRAAGAQLQVGYPPYGILVNGAVNFDGRCQLGRPNLLVTVISDKTLEPHQMPAAFASSCGLAGSFYHFYDLGQPANREYMRRFLEAVPTGYYVAMVSAGNVPFTAFSQAQKDAFRALGSKMIDSVQTGYPFALVGQKGATIGSVTELGYNLSDPLPPQLQTLEIDTNILARGIRGTITSSLIGPASSWGSLHHQVRNNGSGNDRYRLQVIGYDLQRKNPTLLQNEVQHPRQDLSAIDARQYPYLQLSLQVSDSLERTAPQLKEWLVSYQGVPEGVVRADLVGVDQYANLSAQAAKGKIELRYAFQNISGLDFADSLLARISVVGTAISKEMKVAALKKEEVVYIPYTLATQGLKGNYTLRLSVNPLLNNPLVQPEQYYFNNTLDLPFSHNANLPPVLDVVFDGRHIMAGDIVSPSPEISMTLKDEDQYSFIQDPGNMEVYLQLPGSTDFSPVDLNGKNIQFTPAGKDRDFRLVYKPENLADGIYTLRVQGRDRENSRSGFEPYSIPFEVVNESSVTHFYPYPNPFSTKTRFVFTLTGSTIPDKMKIQIMTVTGKVVREIMQEELGPLKIGNNISDFAWDGSDEFGDKLANGVYLYRVVMPETDDFKHRHTAGDKSFKKDFGKIYILR